LEFEESDEEMEDGDEEGEDHPSKKRKADE
jgi:hypothetical protein